MKSKQVIDEYFLGQMLVNRKYLKAFPFLATYAKAKVKSAGCGTCGSGSKEKSPDYDAIKRALASLSADDERKLLQMMDAASAVLFYRGPSGRGERITFPRNS